jgi:hypothetical protein
VGYRQDDWCDKLAYLEFAYNSAKNTTGQTPFLLNYGQEPLEFNDLSLTREPMTVPSASVFVAHMQELAEAAAASIENKATAEYRNAKRKDYEFGVGDKVLVGHTLLCIVDWSTAKSQKYAYDNIYDRMLSRIEFRYFTD